MIYENYSIQLSPAFSMYSVSIENLGTSDCASQIIGNISNLDQLQQLALFSNSRNAIVYHFEFGRFPVFTKGTWANGFLHYDTQRSVAKNESPGKI